MQELENFLTCAKEEGISEDIQRHKEVRQEEEEEGVVVVLRKRARIVCMCMCVCVCAFMFVCVCVVCLSIVLVKVVFKTILYFGFDIVFLSLKCYILIIIQFHHHAQ